MDLLGGVVATGVDGGVTNDGDPEVVGGATGCDGLGVGVCGGLGVGVSGGLGVGVGGSGTFATGSGLLKTGSGF